MGGRGVWCFLGGIDLEVLVIRVIITLWVSRIDS